LRKAAQRREKEQFKKNSNIQRKLVYIVLKTGDTLNQQLNIAA